MSKGCCYCSEKHNFKGKYLYPQKGIDEIIIFLDKNHSTGLLNMEDKVLCLAGNGIEVVTSALIKIENEDIETISDEDEEMLTLISHLVADELFEIKDIEPVKVEISNRKVEKGDTINLNSVKKHVKVDARGNVREINLNDVIVYVYESEDEVEINNPNSNIDSVLVHEKSSNNQIVYPKNLKNLINDVKPKSLQRASVGDSCGACATCGACGLCAFCAGINFGVAGAAVVGTTGTVKVVDLV